MIDKISVFLRSRSVLKNWYILPLIYYKLGRKEHVILETKSGLKIKIRKNSTDFMQFATIWLIDEYTKTDFLIRDEDIIIDIGAHIGLFALFASQFCKKGKIYCFEPVKANFDLLKENLRINNISNVEVHNSAISKIDGNVTMYLNEDFSSHNIMIESDKKSTVSSISLKTFFEKNGLEKCNFLKMDCEGSEYDIIESLPISYFEKIEKIIIEYHFADEKNQIFQKFKAKLETCFELEIEKNSESMGMIYAKKIN